MIFKIRNIVILLIPLLFLVGCNAVKDVASTLNYEKGNVECLLAFADKQKCMVKRLSSSQLCSNFKNWENKKNVNKALYEATLKEIQFRNYKCENGNVVKAYSNSNSETSKTNSKLPNCPSTGRKHNCFGTVISSIRKFVGDF